MFLILAGPDDQAAHGFAAWLSARRIPHAWSHDGCDVRLTTHASRAGETRGCLTLAGETGATPVRAVPNRGIRLACVEPDERFRWGEVTAAWWTALALFDGPVVNRPTRRSFLPDLGLASLEACLPRLVVPSTIGPPDAAPDAPCVNVHRLRDSAYLGRLSSELILDEDELYRYTPFNPRGVHRMVVAGRRIFDVGCPGGAVGDALAALLEPLLLELLRREALFCSVVVDVEGGRPALLEATPVPQPRHYAHLADLVHGALAEFVA